MATLTPVTDSAILAQLNGSIGISNIPAGSGAGGATLKPVIDPAILAQLNGTSAPVAPAAPPSPPPEAAAMGGDVSAAAEAQGANELAGAKNTSDFGRGAVQSAVDRYHGIVQGGATLLNAISPGLVSDEQVASNKKFADEQAAARQAESPAYRAGHVAGNIAQGAALAAIPGLDLASIPMAAGAGAALNVTEPLTGNQTYTNKALWGAAGGVAGGVGARVLGGEAGEAGSQTAQDTEKLLSEDIPLSVEQRTGSEVAGAMTGHAPPAGQQDAVNAAILRRMGVTDTTRVTPQVMEDGYKAIAGTMDNVIGRTPVKVVGTDTDSMKTALELNDIRAEAKATFGPDSPQYGQVNNWVNNLYTQATENGGTLTAKAYQANRTILGNVARSGDPVGRFAGDIQDALDNSLTRSATPEDAAAITQARQQYRAMSQIEGAVDRTTGDISVPKLVNQLKVKSNRNQWVYGEGDQSLSNLVEALSRNKLGGPPAAAPQSQAAGAIEALREGHAGEALTRGASAIVAPAANIVGLGIPGAVMRGLRGEPAIGGTEPWLTNWMAGGGAPLGVGTAFRSKMLQNASIATPGAVANQ